MVVKSIQKKQEEMIDLCGGKGAILMHHILDKEGLNNKGWLYALTTVKPGDTIGYHQHDGECEAYYILSGTAKYKDNDGEYTLEPGDVTYTPSGTSHGIENIGNEDLQFIALILYV